MLLSEVPNAGLIVWSNIKAYNNLFVTGSIDKSVLQQQEHNTDEELLESNYLQLFKFNPNEEKPKLLGKTQVNQPFSALIWTTFESNGTFPKGIIIGGHLNGQISVYNPQLMIIEWEQNKRSQEDQSFSQNIGLIFEGLCVDAADDEDEEQNEEGKPITQLEYNPNLDNLIACTFGNEVKIIDIGPNIEEPVVFNPGDVNYHEDSRVCSVAWNKKVKYILASASENGLVIIWDLKTNHEIFHFQESQRPTNRSIRLSWNPEIPTQIVVAYDDSKQPEIQVWDLRNQLAPVLVFQQVHTDGIISLDWCPFDSQILLSGGRDNKVICWNYSTGNYLTGLDFSDEGVFDIKWNPKLPGICQGTNQDGKVAIHFISDTEFEAYTPKWVKTPAGPRFSFFGQLTQYSAQEGLSIVQVTQTKNELTEPLKQMQKVLFNDEGTSNACCQEKLRQLNESQVKDPDEIEQWKLFSALSSKNYTDELINALGLDKKSIIQKTENYTGKSHRKEESTQEEALETTATSKDQSKARKAYNLAPIQNVDSFFEELSQNALKTSEQKQIKQQAMQVQEKKTMKESVELVIIYKQTNLNFTFLVINRQ